MVILTTASRNSGLNKRSQNTAGRGYNDNLRSTIGKKNKA